MKEELKHIKAFEKYYTLGGEPTKENCRKVSEEFHITERTFWNWYKKLNWRKRVEQRNMENSKKIAGKTDEVIVNTKADYRVEIKIQLGILKAILNKIIEDFKEKRIIEVKSTTGLGNVISSYERLCKLDLLLMGEATERGKLDIDWGRITNEQLDKYIEILGKGGRVELPTRKEEERDKG